MTRTVGRILGIDPGLHITGYAVLEVRPTGPHVCEAGIVKSVGGKGSAGLAERIRSLYDGIAEVIEQYQPQVVVMEQLYAHYKHPRTAIIMGHARGALLLAAAQRDLPVIHYAATRIKKTITGHGRASKDQMQRAIQGELRLAKVPEPPDVADALAAALCHYYAQRVPSSPSTLLSGGERGEVV